MSFLPPEIFYSLLAMISMFCDKMLLKVPVSAANIILNMDLEIFHTTLLIKLVKPWIIGLSSKHCILLNPIVESS